MNKRKVIYQNSILLRSDIKPSSTEKSTSFVDDLWTPDKKNDATNIASEKNLNKDIENLSKLNYIVKARLLYVLHHCISNKCPEVRRIELLNWYLDVRYRALENTKSETFLRSFL